MRISLHFIIWSLVLFLIAAVTGTLLASKFRTEKVSPSVLLTCFSSTSANSSIKEPDDACLKTSVDSLLKTYTTTDLMDYIVASTTPFAIRGYCHAVAHVIGEETFIASANVEAALNACSRKCDFGCIHGVIAADVANELGGKYLTEDIAHADAAEVEKIGTKYCSASGALCHAMGHILYIGTQDIHAAIGGCEKISVSSTTVACNNGVFMEAEGGAATFVKSTTTAKTTNNDYAYPCDSVASKYQFTCFQYLPDFQRQLFVKNKVSTNARFDIVRNTCESFTSEKTRSDCLVGVGYKFISGLDNDGNLNPRGVSRCNSLSGIEHDSCVVGLALQYSVFNTYQDALNYCGGRSDDKTKKLCYDVVFQTMSYSSLQDSAVLARCDVSNNPDECRREYAAYIPVAHSLPHYRDSGLFGDTGN